MLSKIIILRYLHASESDNNIILFVVLARNVEHNKKYLQKLKFFKNKKNTLPMIPTVIIYTLLSGPSAECWNDLRILDRYVAATWPNILLYHSDLLPLKKRKCVDNDDGQ